MSAIRYRYQTEVFGLHDIHFRCLRDRQQYEDPHGEAAELGISSASWPLSGMVWPSGEVLAQLMTTYDIESRRILEIGCGVGLASLVLNERMADISATDIHPCAGDNLQHNTQLNNKRHIPFLRSAWEDTQEESFGVFDLIIGSDLLYERNHSKSLAMVIQNYAKPKCEVILVDAGRGYGPNFTFRMQELGFSRTQLDSGVPHSDCDKYKGKVFKFCRMS